MFRFLWVLGVLLACVTPLRAANHPVLTDDFERPEDLGSIDDLERTRARSLGTVIERPFASGAYFGLIVLLFGLEWTLRRRWGLR